MMRRHTLLVSFLLMIYSGLTFSQPPLFSYNVKTMIASESDFAVDHDLLTQFWQMLQNDHVLEIRFEHKERRNTAIFLQDIVERTLALNAKKYPYLVGFMLTAKPSSALSIADPQAKLREWGISDSILTVSTRHRDLKKLLAAGVPLYSIYPRAGLDARSKEDQTYYRALLKKYANLFDVKLAIKRLPDNYSGAMYLFQDVDANVYAFMIHASQVDRVGDQQTWHLWFGDVQQPAVNKRLRHVFTYLKQNNKDPRLAKDIDTVLKFTRRENTTRPNKISWYE